MDGWMDEWMDRYMNVQIDTRQIHQLINGWMDGWMDRYKNIQIDTRQMHGLINGWTNEYIDTCRWINGVMDERTPMDGWMDGLFEGIVQIRREVDNTIIINLTCNTYISCEYISLNPYIYIK